MSKVKEFAGFNHLSPFCSAVHKVQLLISWADICAIILYVSMTSVLISAQSS